MSKPWVRGNVWSESLGGCYSIQSQNQLEANDGSLQPPDNAKQIVVILVFSSFVQTKKTRHFGVMSLFFWRKEHVHFEFETFCNHQGKLRKKRFRNFLKIRLLFPLVYVMAANLDMHVTYPAEPCTRRAFTAFRLSWDESIKFQRDPHNIVIIPTFDPDVELNQVHIEIQRRKGLWA